MILLEYDNPYWKRNTENFRLLVNLLREFPQGYCRALNAKRDSQHKFYKYVDKSHDYCIGLKQWIESETSFLSDDFWNLTTKCFCIVNGIRSFEQFPHCPTCGKLIRQNAYSITVGFRQHYCSAKCRANNAEFKRRMTDERCAKYGNIFGPWEKIKETKTVKYGDPYWSNPDQASKTKRNFSKEHKAEIEEKKKRTWEKTLGVDNPMRNESVKEKVARTCEKNFGRPYGLDIEKSSATCREHFGVDWPMQSVEVQAKSEATCIRKYGVRHTSMSSEIREKILRQYEYNGLRFDSQHELALYIYAKDKRLPIEKTRVTIPFKFQGKTHWYYPDFFNTKLQRFVEVKGDQFFDENGKMRLAYRQSSQSDEDYKFSCDLMEAKQSCMRKHGVIVIRAESTLMRTIIKYVQKTYGRSFLKSCKIN